METTALDLKMDQQEAAIAKSFKQIDPTTRLIVAFTAMANDDKALDPFLRYETAYTHMHQRAMNNLSKHRKEKLRNDPGPPPQPTTPITPLAPTEPRASASGNVNCETTPPAEHASAGRHLQPQPRQSVDFPETVT
jgi:hypothetical protein